jgi:D-beta-D-heptose 7-phosphate kinase / D-beta-D-heptose 1-phosphate adenosyltransferase
MSSVPARLVQRLQAGTTTVAVLGDLMLDGWWRGQVDRVAREAPVPVVEIDSRSHVPGGAGNTARNLAALGARVRMVGVVGEDQPGRRLRDLLAADGVDVDAVVARPELRTVTKTRVLGAEQILLRLDDCDRSSLTPEAVRDLAERLGRALRGADALVVCDYAQHPWVEVVRQLLARAGRPPLLVVDAHHLAAWAPLAPDLVSPNAREAFALLGRTPVAGETRLDLVVASAAELRERTGATTVAVTLDRDGSVLLAPDGRVHRTTARPGPEATASGAGDTYVAALTAGIAAGLPLDQAADLAQAAADVVVQRPGTAVCSAADLRDGPGGAGSPGGASAPGALPGPVLDAANLARRVAADRDAGRRIVFTNGCFDVLHRGHTSYLAQAAALGDVLVVAVNSDDSVRRLKGPTRPVNTASDRAAVLAALGCVDYVTVFDTDTPIPLLEALRPQVYVKGGDYSHQMLAETPVVEAYGGEVRLVGYVPSQSTTSLVDRIRVGETVALTEPGRD